MTTMDTLKQRYDNAVKKFPLGEILIGELVLIKVEPYTAAQIKKDPSLKDAEPPVYGVGMVVKRLKKVTRVACVWLDFDGFGSPDHLDLDPQDRVVLLVEATMPIARMEIEEDEKVFLDKDDARNTLPAGHCVLRVYDNLAGFIVDHTFLLPRAIEPGGYRAVTSYNAQQNRFAARTADRKWGDVRLSLTRVEDMAMWEKADLVVAHADIWSAYRAAGYDFRKCILDEAKVLSGDHS